MTPEQRFARWVQVALTAFVLLFGYFLLADLHMPLTPQARLIRQVVSVAPRVSGQVAAVEVANNRHVEAGEVLFRIDPARYRLAVEKATLALEQARRENAQLDARIAAARANLAAARADAGNLARDVKRYEDLVKRNQVARQRRDTTLARYQAARARVEAARSTLHRLEVERGQSGDDNLRLRQARNALARAKLDREYTRVRADIAGTVSNLQLEAGSYAAAGSAVLALVADTPDLVADFREKSLRYVDVGTPAAVVFDGWPGEVFKGHVTSLDSGVRNGQLRADGQLADPTESDRWVRNAQRMRLHVALDEAPPGVSPTGALATVQLYPSDNSLLDALGRLQIDLISLLHYIY
ncbi:MULTISPECIES: HlyD family secretion protein [Modicisalibacter]|uniref:HlyD family secretion protein n=1 Tax=Modicisalibacter tunisiensis TaxID=390637 RepID=A0ABS7X2U6_9GAMM|nr:MULTISPECIES: HlyD family secretion protein [Modicisalibacter]MBZ9537356.1 HlyD family secretion protein [Modicisalibacter tunisiensis]MBZ9569222.1 HlyD family secretion protein [Modicisalibacter tunisiensis]